MTTVGHSLTGISLAVLTLPGGQTRIWYLLIGHFYVMFANLSDFPLPGWGHNAYRVSHSVFVTMLLASLLALLLLWPTFQERVGKRVIWAWSAAWLSHMPLDSLYNHGRGIAIFWPFSNAHLAMPVPWFETVSLPPMTEQNLRVFGIEAMFYGVILLLCIWLRRVWSRAHVDTTVH